ncbi:MAG: hypothetical protein ACI89D_000993 [Bermanella sp.]|jgi:hypothetical protein
MAMYFLVRIELLAGPDFFGGRLARRNESEHLPIGLWTVYPQDNYVVIPNYFLMGINKHLIVSKNDK